MVRHQLDFPSPDLEKASHLYCGKESGSRWRIIPDNVFELLDGVQEQGSEWEKSYGVIIRMRRVGTMRYRLMCPKRLIQGKRIFRSLNTLLSNRKQPVAVYLRTPVLI